MPPLRVESLRGRRIVHLEAPPGAIRTHLGNLRSRGGLWALNHSATTAAMASPYHSPPHSPRVTIAGTDSRKISSSDDSKSESQSKSQSLSSSHAAATVIPIRHSLRDRSNTCPDRFNSRSVVNRRRAETTSAQSSESSKSHRSPLPGHLAHIAECHELHHERQSESPPSHPFAPSHTPHAAHTPYTTYAPSAPIPIPPRKKSPARPVTPLTAREPKGHYFPLHGITPAKPKPEVSLRPYHSRTGNRLPHSHSQNKSQSVTTDLTSMSPRPAQPAYRPSSPLVPSMPIPIPRNDHQQKVRRPAHNLNLTGLPKFHPANFSHAESNTPLSPRSARLHPLQSRTRHASEVQQQLHQYQRDVVNYATRQSAQNPKPTSPRLAPLGSPGGPMTPLMLEAQGDYLLARSEVPPSGFKEGDGRELVERLVRRENERRAHPEARSGSLSPAVSPAVSPAGGRV